jgi:hypothetical protein
VADEGKKTVEARVILDHGDHRIDDIITGAEAEAAIDAGHADGAPAAVAYAKKLARRKAREAADAED